MSHARLFALALCACLTLTARGVLAAVNELGIVVLDRSTPPAPGEAWAAAAQRTRAELGAVGLSVVDVDALEQDSTKPAGGLARAARTHGAVAGVRLIRYKQSSAADIWLVDEVTGKTSLRRVSTHNLPESEAIAVVAFAVVELLNASLLELRATHRRRGSAAPTAAVMTLVDRSLKARLEPYRFALRGGAVLIGSPGGLDWMVGPALGVGWGFHPDALLEAEAFVSATQSEVEGRAGRALVRVGAARILLLFRGAESQVQPLLGAGAGVLVARASGEPSPGFRAADDSTAVLLPSIVVGAAIRASSSLRIRLAVNGGFAVPALSTTLAGERAATSGRPLVDTAIALQWVFRSMESAAQ